MALQLNLGSRPQWPFRYRHRQNRSLMPEVFYTPCGNIVGTKTLAASHLRLGEDVAKNGAAEF
jgi:hypothetical protein